MNAVYSRYLPHTHSLTHKHTHTHTNVHTYTDKHTHKSHIQKVVFVPDVWYDINLQNVFVTKVKKIPNKNNFETVLLSCNMSCPITE